MVTNTITVSYRRPFYPTRVSDANNKEKVRQAFAARLRLALGDLEIAPQEQRRLQKLFGVTGQAVRKWIEGSAMPTASRMPLVAERLGVRRGWLQDGEGPMRPAMGIEDVAEGAAEEGGRLTPAEARLLQRYRLLKSPQREAVDLIVESMIRSRRD